MKHLLLLLLSLSLFNCIAGPETTTETTTAVTERLNTSTMLIPWDKVESQQRFAMDTTRMFSIAYELVLYDFDVDTHSNKNIGKLGMAHFIKMGNDGFITVDHRSFRDQLSDSYQILALKIIIEREY